MGLLKTVQPNGFSKFISILLNKYKPERHFFYHEAVILPVTSDLITNVNFHSG